MRLDEGWNQIQFNLSDFTRRAYGTNYIETLRVQIHANCRIRRIYFSDRLYSEEELPSEFKLFLRSDAGNTHQNVHATPTGPGLKGSSTAVTGGPSNTSTQVAQVNSAIGDIPSNPNVPVAA